MALGRALSRSLPLPCLVLLATHWLDLQRLPGGRQADQRAAMIRDLETQGGRHLVLVRNTDLTPHLHVWLYNQADLDGASVVWARDLGPKGNRTLLEHYRGRRLWTLQADGDLELHPYAAP